MRLGLFVALALSSLISLETQAKVFNVDSEKFSAYLRATYFPTAFENTAFSESNGANVTVAEKFNYSLSGEFGFTYATPTMNFRFGFELIQPPQIKDTGLDGSSVAMYDIKSSASVLIPKIGLEINLKKYPQARFFLNLGAGAATLSGRNDYTMTSAGTTALGPTDFAEDLRGTALLYEGSFGFETLMVDMTTFTIEAGYRMLNFTEIKHNKDNAIIGSGVVKGDTAKNADGTNRTLNLGGPYLGVMFRFWLF